MTREHIEALAEVVADAVEAQFQKQYGPLSRRDGDYEGCRLDVAPWLPASRPKLSRSAVDYAFEREAARLADAVRVAARREFDARCARRGGAHEALR